MLILLTGCSTETFDTDVPKDAPIVFAPVTREVTEATRAAGSGLEHDFVACGYKTIPQGQQYVMPKYDVTYSAGTYNYVTAGQPQVYWDSNATEYRFWGYTGSKANVSANGTVVTIPVSLQKELSASLPLFSELKLITEIDYKTVKLEFLRPVSRVCVIFYSEQPLTDGREVSITDIALAPKANSQEGKVSKIWNAGTVTVRYPLSGETHESVSVSQNNPSAVSDNLPFRDVTLVKDAGDDIENAVCARVPEVESNYYYSLPMDGKNPDFVLSMKLDGEDKTVVVPEQYMHWQANHSYTYIFKITNMKKVVLHDVSIGDWTSGGSQDDEFKNW